MDPPANVKPTCAAVLRRISAREMHVLTSFKLQAAYLASSRRHIPDAFLRRLNTWQIPSCLLQRFQTCLPQLSCCSMATRAKALVPGALLLSVLELTSVTSQNKPNQHRNPTSLITAMQLSPLGHDRVPLPWKLPLKNLMMPMPRAKTLVQVCKQLGTLLAGVLLTGRPCPRTNAAQLTLALSFFVLCLQGGKVHSKTQDVNILRWIT